MSACAADDAPAEFAKTVESWVGAALESASDFGALLGLLPGVDPVVAVEALDALACGTGVIAQSARAMRRQIAAVPPAARPTSERPIPHPLEFYWAHDRPSVEALVARLAVETGPGDDIAHLGTPNIFASALESLADRRNVLFDRSVPRTQVLGDIGHADVRQVDLLASPLPALRARAAILDPPWYPPLMRGFLWAAACVTRPGAIVLASLPPLARVHRRGPKSKNCSGGRERGDLSSWNTAQERCTMSLLRLKSPHIGPRRSEAFRSTGAVAIWRCSG